MANYSEQDKNAFTDRRVLDFAAGHVVGIRLMRCMPVPTPNLVGGRRWVLRSMYCNYVWKPDINLAGCLNYQQVRQGYRIRTKECRETHTHLAELFADGEADGSLPECYYEHDKERIDPGHSCGFYAYTETADNPYLGAIDLSVEAVIQGWGRTVIGTKGFRCERARILGLVLPPHEGQSYKETKGDETYGAIADSIRRTYRKVHAFTSRDAMLRAFPLTSGLQESREKENEN